ncbi:hypothetical protein N7470_008831 [Penicillium chermesinum]|nr:hypothetical protein N7470_008831 [Penicillium chermesinum]
MARNSTSDKEHPLSGAVICFTSVPFEQKTQLVSFAKEMGAIERPDLTSEVTHLLVGATDSPKYKFVARERNDVVVLKPEWIEAVRVSWMEGEDTDIHALEKQYKLPTFIGLTLCITGFTDMGFRTKLHDAAVENGAEFRKDLTKSVTHLISRNTEGEKYRFATQWNIKVVTINWFHDCLERGLILDEEKYHPSIPLEEQGVGAWNRPRVDEKKESRRAKTMASENNADLRPRKKLRRSASTKLVGQNENIWGDIIGAGFMNETAVSKAPNAMPNEPASKPVLQVAKSFAKESTFAETQPRPRDEEAPKVPDGFLGGSFFYIHGFSPKQMGVLTRHLEFNGALCTDSLSEFASPTIPKTGQGLYIMVPYQTPRSKIPSTDELAFEYLRICSTGFGGIDLLHVSKLVNLMGASYDEVLTPKASVLICNDPQNANQDKLRHTREWAVPAVSADWFWTSIQTGQKKPFDPYLIRKQTTQPVSGVEKPGAGFDIEKPEIPQDVPAQDRLTKAPEGHGGKQKAEKPLSVRSSRDRVMSIIDNGFSLEDEDDAPKPSVPDSRSPSPENPSEAPVTEAPAPKTAEPDRPKASAEPSALDTALKGFLQQAQAAKSRQQSENTTTQPEAPRRKRKPLLGRAPSHSSSKVLDTAGAPSRASSIDTLNDDGLGSALESEGSFSRTNSRANDQSISSMFSGKKFDFDSLAKLPGRVDDEEDEENHEPPMTQLGYEDADAAAMRAEFLRNAGKLTDKTQRPDSSLLLGEVRELEDVGWASGRRTRRQPPKPDEM